VTPEGPQASGVRKDPLSPSVKTVSLCHCEGAKRLKQSRYFGNIEIAASAWGPPRKDKKGILMQALMGGKGNQLDQGALHPIEISL
jgi:hypothetical protein